MALTVNYSKAGNKDEAFDLAKAQITPEYIEKFKVKAGVDYDKTAGKMIATGKGFTLTLSFGKSSVDAKLELSFFLKAFKGKILETLERKLTKNV
jgi:hypothetical protein